MTIGNVTWSDAALVFMLIVGILVFIVPQVAYAIIITRGPSERDREEDAHQHGAGNGEKHGE